MQAFATEGKSWEPLWLASQDKADQLLKKKEVKQQEIDLLSYAQNSFLESMDSLLREKAKESIKLLSETDKNLKELVFKIRNKNRPMEMIQQLLVFYTYSLEEDPLQESTLIALIRKEKVIGELAAKNSPLNSAQLNPVQVNLASGLLSLDKDQQAGSRVFIEESEQILKRLLYSLNHKNTPQDILENAVSEQDHSLSLNHLKDLIRSSDLAAGEIDNFMLASQKMALDDAAPFEKTVLAQEIKEFHSTISQEQEDYRCQYQPWNEAIPSFEKGLENAQYALTYLQQKLGASEVQESALKAWRQALEKMRQPKIAKSCSFSGGGGGGSQNASSGSFDYVLRVIQEMNNEDQLPTPKTIPKEVARPW